MTDYELYNSLIQHGLIRMFTFNNKDLFIKSQKFLKHIGYELHTEAYADKKMVQYCITLMNFIVLPTRESQIKEVINNYMELEGIE